MSGWLSSYGIPAKSNPLPLHWCRIINKEFLLRWDASYADAEDGHEHNGIGHPLCEQSFTKLTLWHGENEDEERQLHASNASMDRMVNSNLLYRAQFVRLLCQLCNFIRQGAHGEDESKLGQWRCDVPKRFLQSYAQDTSDHRLENLYR